MVVSFCCCCFVLQDGRQTHPFRVTRFVDVRHRELWSIEKARGSDVIDDAHFRWILCLLLSWCFRMFWSSNSWERIQWLLVGRVGSVLEYSLCSFFLFPLWCRFLYYEIQSMLSRSNQHYLIPGVFHPSCLCSPTRPSYFFDGAGVFAWTTFHGFWFLSLCHCGVVLWFLVSFVYMLNPVSLIRFYFDVMRLLSCITGPILHLCCGCGLWDYGRCDAIVQNVGLCLGVDHEKCVQCALC